MCKLFILIIFFSITGSAFAEDIKEAEAVADARQSYYTLIGFNMNGLAKMAKGETEYDPQMAKTLSANILTLSGYSIAGLYLPGTSTEELPGKTRALPKIWTNFPDVQMKGEDYYKALVALTKVAEQGQQALGGAVQNLGATCKACHDTYRAKDF